jgi:molybdopterin-guanine dinucleotide biosynthesis protein A
MIERVIERSAALGQSRTILITNQPAAYESLGLPMFGDVIADKGSLGGIYTALMQSQTTYTLVLACDMPFVSPELLRLMHSFTINDEYDVVVPRVDGYPQGLHAIYGAACREPIRDQLEANRLKVIGFYDSVRVKYLDEADYHSCDQQHNALMNVNTPQELERAKQYL